MGNDFIDDYFLPQAQQTSPSNQNKTPNKGTDLLGLSATTPTDSAAPNYSGMLIDVLGESNKDQAADSNNIGGVDLFTGSINPEDNFNKWFSVIY